MDGNYAQNTKIIFSIHWKYLKQNFRVSLEMLALNQNTIASKLSRSDPKSANKSGLMDTPASEAAVHNWNGKSNELLE